MSVIGKSFTPIPKAWENTDGRPSWSPDGTRVAAEVGRDVVVINREGGQVLNTIGPEGHWVNSPSWSPDGKRIAYSTYDKHRDYDVASWGIYSSNPDGSDPKLLSPDAMEPEFSPQGDRVAFQLYKAGFPERIGLVNADGTDMKPISNGGFVQRDFSWSPGGHQIAYDTMDQSGVQVTDITGRKDRPITDGAGGLFNDRNPEWSPVGDDILFERNSTAVVANGLWTINSKTGKEAELLPVSRRNLDATWSPDGSRIAFASNRDGGEDLDIYVMDADGTDIEQITDLEGNEHAPSWSPDGKAIAFNRLDFGAPRDKRESVEIVELKN
jgi:TolB protein